jgi:predicted lipoprotein with Yx(FWY)xxD motif
MKISRAVCIVVASIVAVSAVPVLAKPHNVMTSRTDMTIYAFGKDRTDSGKSVCAGPCAALWPGVPAADAPAGAPGFGAIERADGTQQLTYKGRPVYYHAQDRAPGDAIGDNVGALWHVIRVLPSGDDGEHEGYPYSNY